MNEIVETATVCAAHIDAPIHRERAPSRPIAIALLVFAGACGDGVPEWCVVPEGGERRLAAAPATWSAPPGLTVEWRIDGSAPGRELVLPTSAAVSAATGRIAIIDFGVREAVVISRDGEWLGRWGRGGEGPGEFTAPYAAAWRPDGGLIVYDPARSKLVVFDSTGTILDDEPVDPAFTAALGGGARSIQLDGSGLLLAEPGGIFRAEGSTREHSIIRGGNVGAPVDTVVRSEVPVVVVPGAGPLTAPGWQVPLGAIHGDSVLAVAGDRPEYLIRVFRNGRPSHTICRVVDPVPYTTEESEPHQEVPEEVEVAMARAGTPSTPARIGRLAIDGQLRLWVQRDRPRALSGLDFVIGRPGATFDVFDDEGHYLGEVRLPSNVRFIGTTDDLIIGLESSEFDELSVVALRIG